MAVTVSVFGCSWLPKSVGDIPLHGLVTSSVHHMPFALGYVTYVYTRQVNLMIKSINLIRGLVSEVAQPVPFVAGYATVATKVSPTYF